MTKYFCCCVPVRFGVFTISLSGLVFSSLAASALWWTITHQGDAYIVTLHSGSKLAFIAQAVHYTIVAIASAIGLYGTLAKKRGVLVFYSGFSWVSLIVSVALGGWSIYKASSTFDSSVKACKDDIKNGISRNVNQTVHANFTTSTQGHTFNDCISAPVAKAVYITIFIISLLHMAYGTITVHHYKQQLNEEKGWDARHDVANQSTKVGYLLALEAESHPLVPHYQQTSRLAAYSPYRPVATSENFSNYPYTASEHSYGKAT